jgi:hypothetical protein
MKKLRQVSVMALCSFLFGCNTLSKSIEQRMQISDQCRLATSAVPINWRVDAPVASIHLGNVGFCDIEQTDTLLPVCSLKKIRMEHDLNPGNDEWKKVINTELFDEAVKNLETSLNELKDRLKGVDQHYSNLLFNFKKPGYERRTEIVKLAKNDLIVISATLHKTRNEQRKLRREIAKLGPAVLDQAAVQLRAWDANLHAQLNQLEVLLAGDVSMVLRDGLKDQVLTHLAQRTLELLHGSLKAPGAIINRLDNEAYGAISVSYLLMGPDIQSAVDKAFKTIQINYGKRLEEIPDAEVRNVDVGIFLNELGRAACGNLLAGTEFSLLSELVDTALIRQIKLATPPRLGEASDHVTVQSRQESRQLDGRLRFVKTLYQQQAQTQTPATNLVSPLAVYMTNEWMARQQLLEEAIRKKFSTSPTSAGNANQSLLAIETVSETAVQRLANSATAKVLDDAVREYPALLTDTVALDSRLAGSVNVTTAASAVSLAAVVLDVNISVNNVNSFSPTNYNNVNPVIHLTVPSAATGAPSLCSPTGFAVPGAVCARDDDDYVITFSKQWFGSDSCQVSDMEPALSAVGQRLSEYGSRYGMHYDAKVHGFSSLPAARLARCATSRVPVLDRCAYRNKLHQVVTIPGCRRVSNDRNWHLSAARARNAAEVIEQAANGAVVIKEIVARGTETAHLTTDKTMQAADQTIVLRLSRHVGAGQTR